MCKAESLISKKREYIVMEQRIRLAHILFILLPVFLLASPVYASMGDINICFPFFLLLAALMAAMLAQGKSPLVGFDISTSRPPAEVRSTSYHFKSINLSYQTDAKARNMVGGGNVLTRGVGWVADKVGQGGAKAVSAASGGKYGSKQAKEGLGWARRMSERGALYAITKGRKGGGAEAHYERERKAAENKKKAAEGKKEEAETKVKSLTKDLTKLGRGKATKGKRDKKREEMQNAKRDISKHQETQIRLGREIAVLEDARKHQQELRRSLTDLAGVKGRLKQPLYPTAVALGAVTAGLTLSAKAAKRKIDKSRNKRKLDNLRDEMRKLHKNVGDLEGKSKLSSEDKKQLDENKRRIGDLKIERAYLRSRKRELGQPGAFEQIFGYGQEGRKAKDIAKAYGKRAVFNALWVLPDQSVTWEKIKRQLPGNRLAIKLQRAETKSLNVRDNISEMKSLLKDLKEKPGIVNKMGTLNRIAKLQKQVEKTTRVKGMTKILLNKDKKLDEAHGKVEKNISDLIAFYDKGGKPSTKEGENLTEKLNKSVAEIDKRTKKTPELKRLEKLEKRREKNPTLINQLSIKVAEKKAWADGYKNTGMSKKQEEARRREEEARKLDSSVGYAKLLDWNKEAMKSNKALRMMDWGLAGMGKTQQVRHQWSEWENQIGPAIQEIEKEKAKAEYQRKLLGPSPEEEERKRQKKILGRFVEEEEKKRSKRENLKAWLSKKTGREMERGNLYYKQKRLTDEIKELGSELKTADAKQKAKLKQEIKNKVNERRAVNASIRMAEMQLKNAERRVEKTTNFLLSNEVQLAYRQQKAFRDEEDEFSRRVLPKIEKLDEKVEKYKDKMQLTASTLGKNSGQYQRLKKEQNALKKERKSLEKSVEEEKDRLESGLKEARQDTKIKAGGEIGYSRDQIWKKMDKINLELIRLELKPNKKRKEYLEKEKSNLEKKWDSLKTIDAGKWIHDEMKRVGDYRLGSETGLFRDKAELDLLGQHIDKTMDKLKTDYNRAKSKERKEQLSKEMKQLGKEREQLVRDTNVLVATLYLKKLEFERVIDVGTSYTYQKELIDKVQEARKNCPADAERESKLMQKRILITDGERAIAEKANWTQEVERLNKRIDELKKEKTKLDSIAKKPPASPSTYNVSFDELKKAEDNLIRTADMHETAELLMRKEDSGKVGGLMQPDTRAKLELTEKVYPKSDTNFWNEANQWAGKDEKEEMNKVANSMYVKYESEMIKKRAEIKEKSEKIDEIINKPEYIHNDVHGLSAKDSKELKDLIAERKESQRELREIYDEWKTSRNYHRAATEPFRRVEKLTGPGSEEQRKEYIEGYAEDVRKKEVAGRLEPVAEPTSRAVEKLFKFTNKNLGKVLLATAIASPFVILPLSLAGAGAALAATGVSAGIFAGKGAWRESHKYCEGTYSKTYKVTTQLIEMGSHFTARGSGYHPQTWGEAWESQTAGNENIYRGFRLDENGNLVARPTNLQVPSVGLPWFIRWTKATIEPAAINKSIWSRRRVLNYEFVGKEDQLRRTMAENPNYTPEIPGFKWRRQYQFITPYGSAGPSIFPKQAAEMTEKYREISLNVPFQEEAKNILIMKQYAPSPLERYLNPTGESKKPKGRSASQIYREGRYEKFENDKRQWGNLNKFGKGAGI